MQKAVPVPIGSSTLKFFSPTGPSYRATTTHSPTVSFSSSCRSTFTGDTTGTAGLVKLGGLFTTAHPGGATFTTDGLWFVFVVIIGDESGPSTTTTAARCPA